MKGLQTPPVNKYQGSMSKAKSPFDPKKYGVKPKGRFESDSSGSDNPQNDAYSEKLLNTIDGRAVLADLKKIVEIASSAINKFKK